MERPTETETEGYGPTGQVLKIGKGANVDSFARLPGVFPIRAAKPGDLFYERMAGAKYVYRAIVLPMPGRAEAQFNRRMRKTACPVVWKGHGVQSPVPPSDPYGTSLRE